MTSKKLFYIIFLIATSYACRSPIIKEGVKIAIEKVAVKAEIENAVFGFLPTSVEQSTKVFGEQRLPTIISPTQLEKFYSNDNARLLTNKQQLLESIGNLKEGSHPIIIAHNNAGIIETPSGEKISFYELDIMCKKRKLEPIIISCNAAKYTKNFAPDYKINIKEALELTEIVQANGRRGVTKAEIDGFFKDFEKLRTVNHQKFYVKRVAMSGAIATGGWLITKKR